MSDHETRVRGDRRHLSTTEAATLFALIFQIAALVWGAATLTANVRELSGVVGTASVDLKTLGDRLDKLSTDVRVLQDHDTQRSRGH